MCGGYARVCVRCGRCGKVEPRPLNEAGHCVKCGFDNAADSVTCAQCGSPLPLSPGQSMTFKTIRKQD